MTESRLSRRAFLRTLVAAGGTSALAACGAATTAPTAVPAPTSAPTAAAAPTTATVAGATTAPVATTAAAPATDLALSSEFVLDAPDHVNGWKTTLLRPTVKYDPPVRITQNLELPPDVTFAEGEAAENNIATRFFKETIGIDYQPKWVAQIGEAADVKWATGLASGDIPDFMTRLTNARVSKLYEADGLEDITDIWERVATPRTKEWKGYPDHRMWGIARRDGRVYGIPYVSSGANPYGNDNLLWIRKDWLDKVGLKAPGTIDELVAAGTAFMKQGLASFGLATLSMLVPDYGAWMGPLDSIFGAYDAMPGIWRSGADGKLVFGSTQPQVKTALGVLQEWYNSGFLAKDFITITDPSALAEPVADGKVGIMFGPGWCVGYPFADAVAKDPSADWQAFAAPKGPQGKQMRRGSDLHGTMSGFRRGVDPKIVEASIEHLNWRYEREASSYDNHDYFEFFNYSLIWDGDKLKPGPSNVNNYSPGLGSFPSSNHLASFGIAREARKKVLAKDTKTWNALEQRRYGNPDSLKESAAYDLADDTKEQQLFNEFYGIPGPLMTDLQPTLQQLELTTFAEIITGKKPLSAFEDFVTAWEAAGGTDLTAEVNAWRATKA